MTEGGQGARRKEARLPGAFGGGENEKRRSESFGE